MTEAPSLSQTEGMLLRRLGQVTVLLALLVVEVPLILLSVVMLVLAVAMGMVFLFQPQVRMVRRLAELNRRLLRAWTGIPVEARTCPSPRLPCRDWTGCTAQIAPSTGRRASPPGTIAGSG